MNEILKMLRYYAKVHKIEGGVNVKFEDDGSGEVRRFIGLQEQCFYFSTVEEFLKKIQCK